MRHFSRHANALTKRGMGVNGFADVDGVCTHLDGQHYLADHVACVGADHAAAQDLAVAPASMTARSCFGPVIKQQLGNTLFAAPPEASVCSAQRSRS